ncbi:hypothetical protein [Novosphingobium album (ex Liu et al. 2023)]|uniref:Uncharacterized protein n=1 Tax=Novosphingobium album (ex Liu et al. 2023) TaxID=3031130 RepID=A0ABT5WSL6_9SPHN|nr:hypothetical protein [Novosphingobium album (ex Liu et al. 2023)]MDE8652844.1 hypothetical protein [Novosphingobium album (ex Liu et al. 2023)]
MVADSRDFTLDISEPLFRLTTEGIRLHSNETLHYQTLSNLVDHQTSRADRIGDHDTSTLKEHLVSIPSDGSIRLNLNISRTSVKNLDEVKKLLSRQLGSELTVADTLSILLFDYVVEQKTACIMEKLDLHGLERSERSDFANGGSS